MEIGTFGILLIVAAILTGLAAFRVSAPVDLGWLGVTVFLIALLVR